MIRSKIFALMRFFYILMDRGISLLFGERVRQQYVRMGYKIKTRLFPQYGSYIPETTAIGSMTKNLPWVPPPIPDWVLSEMRDLGRDIDPALYPTQAFVASCQYYVFPVVPKPGELYAELIQNCRSDHYTHCFAIPWLKKGGADIVTLHHINFAVKQKNAKVLVILTEPGDSPWLSRIPKNVDVIDASKLVGKIAYDDLLLILVRLLVQLRIDVLHVINSKDIWEVICKYGLAIRQKTRIFASLFCDDYDDYGQPVGFARRYLPECYKNISKVFSDNEAFPRLLQQTYGYLPETFTVLKSPLEAPLAPVATRSPNGRRVIWAGRLDRQKRPDLLLSIALAMPDVEFFVYGDPVLNQKTKIIDKLQKLKNVNMTGGFDGAGALPFHEFSLFLYTSQWDGTPTIVIAAAHASIPIVASQVGGVGGIITTQRGYPVSDIENVEAYITAILSVLNNPEEAEERAKAAHAHVKVAHSEENFESVLRATKGYLVSQDDKHTSITNKRDTSCVV